MRDGKFNVIISENAGSYLCNNIYYNGLKSIKDMNLKSKMIFIHIPEIKDIDEIKLLSDIFK